MRPDWSSIRAQIEARSKTDALDMTWVRFKKMWDSIPSAIRRELNLPYSPEEEFRDAREGK